MTLWCIFRSPLMFGGELRDNDEFTKSLLTNAKVINMNRNGRKARQVMRKDDLVIWKSQTKDGKLYVAMFNIGEKKKKAKIKFKELGLDKKQTYSAVEVWTNVHHELANSNEFELKPHTVICYEIEASLE